MAALIATVPVAPLQPIVAPSGTLVIPVASASCPSFGGAGVGTDWNPLDHIPVIGDAAHLASNVGGILGTVEGWIQNPTTMVHDVVGWVTWHTIGWNPDAPNCYQPTSAYGFAKSVVAGEVQLDASSLYAAAYSELSVLAIVVVFAAAIARIIRAAYEPGTHWATALAGTVLRAVAGIAFIQLGFAVLNWILPACAQMGHAMFVTFLSLSVPGVHGFDPLAAILFAALHAASGLDLIGVLLVPVLLFQLAKVIVLMVLRFVVISFGIAATPLFIAIAVFDHRAAVVRWWWGMMLGAAIVPIVSAALIGLTLGLAFGTASDEQSVSSLVVAPLVSDLLLIGGCWLTGRALRACLFGLTGQQSGMALLRHAVETALFLPAAVGSLVTVGALAASGAGVRALLPGLGMGRYGSGLVQSALRTDNPISRAAGLRYFETPTAAFNAFRSSPEGDRFIADVTRDVLPKQMPAADRWSAVERLPGMDRAMRQVRTSVHAESARSGRLAVGADAWATFEEAVARGWARAPRSSRGAAQQRDENSPQGDDA
jgi:hypothetical protein